MGRHDGEGRMGGFVVVLTVVIISFLSPTRKGRRGREEEVTRPGLHGPHGSLFIDRSHIEPEGQDKRESKWGKQHNIVVYS